MPQGSFEPSCPDPGYNCIFSCFASCSCCRRQCIKVSLFPVLLTSYSSRYSVTGSCLYSSLKQPSRIDNATPSCGNNKICFFTENSLPLYRSVQEKVAGNLHVFQFILFFASSLKRKSARGEDINELSPVTKIILTPIVSMIPGSSDNPPHLKIILGILANLNGFTIPISFQAG